MEKSPFENDKIEIVGTSPAINKKYSTIGRQIEFPQAR